MAISIWIVADLLPWVALAVFAVAAAADPVARLRRRSVVGSDRERRRAPQRAHESRA